MAGKFFVGGIAPETSEDDLRNYFGQFGELVDVAVMKDSFGMPRCFGFVQYADPSAHTCNPADEHFVSGKKVDVKMAVPKDSIAQGAALRTNKIFVGGLSKASTADSIRAHFSAFGNVTDVLMKYNEMGESRGFCFVEFDSEDVAESACNAPGMAIDGKEVECKLARPLGDRSLMGKGKGGKGGFGMFGGFGKGGFGKGGPMRNDFFGKGSRPSPYGGFGAAPAFGGGFGKGASFGKGAGFGGRGPAPAAAYGAPAAAPAGWGSYSGAPAAYPAAATGYAAPAAGGYGGYSGGGYAQAAAPAAAASYGGYGGYAQAY